jgi:hypothetical protein
MLLHSVPSRKEVTVLAGSEAVNSFYVHTSTFSWLHQHEEALYASLHLELCGATYSFGHTECVRARE